MRRYTRLILRSVCLLNTTPHSRLRSLLLASSVRYSVCIPLACVPSRAIVTIASLACYPRLFVPTSLA